MSFSMSNTKAQLLMAICELENQNMRQARELAEMRTQVSILQGELALRPRPKHEVVNGVTITREPQRTIKRWMPSAQTSNV